MNWDEVGAIGEVLGSIAVFLTLGYLAVQVRYARREVQRSISQSRADAVRELLLNRANSERLVELNSKANVGLKGRPLPFVTALMEQAGLTEEESYTLFSEQMAWWNYRSQVIAYIDELPEGERIQFDAAIQRFFGHPVARLWYDTLKSTLSPEAVRYVDDVVARSV
jgi:hypothetical protein